MANNNWRLACIRRGIQLIAQDPISRAVGLGHGKYSGKKTRVSHSRDHVTDLYSFAFVWQAHVIRSVHLIS